MNDNGVRKEQNQEQVAEHPGYTVVDDEAKAGAQKFGIHWWVFPALSPFVFILFGFAFGWWAWGWIIIPVCGILGTPMKFWIKCVSLSPFIYMALGFFFGWWAWAWIIIPICGILSSGVYRRA